MAELLRDGDTDESHGAWLRRAWLAEEARRSIESEPSTMKRSVTPIIHKVSARTPANECSPSFLTKPESMSGCCAPASGTAGQIGRTHPPASGPPQPR